MIYLYSKSKCSHAIHAWNRCLFLRLFVCMPVSELWMGAENKMDIVFHLLFTRKNLELNDVEYFRTVNKILSRIP